MKLLRKKWIILSFAIFVAMPQGVLSDAPPQLTHQLIINEVMAGSEVNPEKDHWIELYNPTDEEILLFNWKIRGVTEGGNWINLVAEHYRAIQPHDFFLISHYTNSRSSALEVRPQVNKTSFLFPAGPLSIELQDPQGQISDQIFIERNTGELDYRSYERRQPIIDGTLAESWLRATQSVNLKPGLILTFATPFSANSELLSDEEVPPPPPPLASILINEVLPNPKKREAEQEFIELLNVSQELVDLRGWELDDENGEDDQSYFFIDESRDYLLDPGEFLVLYNSETLISLGNLGDGVQLFDGEGNLMDDFFYAPELEGRSWGRNPEDPESWVSFNHPTPGQINIEVNYPPAPAIHVQQDTRYMTLNVTGEQSYDPDGDRLTFLWEYEPGSPRSPEVTSGEASITETRENPLEYTYAVPGPKTISLTVTDEFGLSANTQIVFEATPVPGSSTPSRRFYSDLALIHEVIPSPEGKDEEGEWVELFNPTAETVDLSGWFLDDAEGLSRPFRIPDQTTLNPDEYRVFTGLDLSFRNSEDEVRLLDPNGEAKQTITYREVHEAWSYAKDGQSQFIWTPLVTPGAPNAFPLPPPSYQKGDLVFEAVLPNPTEKDEGNELIRLRNSIASSIDLKDWQIQDSSGKRSLFESLVIEAGQTQLLTQDVFRLTLNNEDEHLILFDPAGNEIDRMEWREAASGQWMIVTAAFHDGLELPVLRVIDGDTIVADYEGMPLTLRLLGVDTPETVHPFKAVQFFGREASHYLKNRLEGQMVRLAFEPNKLDKYGRLLAYVYLGDTLINAELIEKGYAYAYTRFPFQHRYWFIDLETKAKAAGLGLWQNLKVRKIIEEQQESSTEELLEKSEVILRSLEVTEESPQLLITGEILRDAQDDIEARDNTICISSFLKIDSVLPNPQKGESVETIRLINIGPETVCLQGWSLDDDTNKGSKPYLISGGSIAPGGVRTFRKDETKIALNNKDDCASLLNPAGLVVDQICYSKTHKNEIFTHEGGNWVAKSRGHPAKRGVGKTLRAVKKITRSALVNPQATVRIASIYPKSQSLQPASPELQRGESAPDVSPMIPPSQPFVIPFELQMAFFVGMMLGFLSLFRTTFFIKINR